MCRLLKSMGTLLFYLQVLAPYYNAYPSSDNTILSLPSQFSHIILYMCHKNFIPM